MNSYNKKFKALVVRRKDNKTFNYKVETRDLNELKKNNILIKVFYSSINYKDGMSCLGNPAITRRFPHTPGVDAAGIIEESDNKEFKKGEKVIVIGFPLGMNISGGFGEYIYVPKEWVLKLNFNLSFEECMAFGTAGYTAGLAVQKIYENYLILERKEFIISGVTGGCGSFAAAILKKLGASITGISRRTSNLKGDYKDFYFDKIIDTHKFIETNKQNLSKPQWDGGLDFVGGKVFVAMLKNIKIHGHVTSAGNAFSSEINTNLLPFILRGLTLHGVNAEENLKKEKEFLWNKLSNEWKPKNFKTLYKVITLEELPSYMKLFIEGKTYGRIVIKHKN